ncbi:MAG: hypothetical protein ABSG80_07885 [Verrucomicrobiota bacterium]
MQVCHAGIKPRGNSNEKREEKPGLADSLSATAQTIFGKMKMFKPREGAECKESFYEQFIRADARDGHSLDT